MSRFFRRIIPLFTVILCLSPLPWLRGEQWPSDPENLRRVFGSDNGNCINLSLDFINGGIVKPFKEGEAFFILLDENSLIPYNTGNSVVVEHSRGFRSYYTGLNRKISPVLEKKNVAVDTILGESDALGFYVKDLELDCFVNPLPLLPLPESGNSLQLNTVKLSGVEGDFELKNGMTLHSGEYALILDTQDGFGGMADGFPQKIVISIQGKEVLRTVFDMVESIDGRFRLSGDLQQGYKTVYGHKEFITPGYIRLISGRTQLQIDLFDLYGNKKRRILEFIVRD